MKKNLPVSLIFIITISISAFTEEIQIVSETPEITISEQSSQLTSDSDKTDQSPQITSDSLPHIITYIDSPVVEQRQVYTCSEIEQMHSQDLPSLFQAAGIQILSYGPYGLEQKPSIRGFTDETVRVVINGICVNNPQYGTFDFTSLNPSDIEKIEIVRGGFTEGISDEGAVAGVIYITTKKQSLGKNFSTDTQFKTFFNPSWPLDTISQSAAFNGQTGENTFLKISLKGTAAKNAFQFKNYKNITTTRTDSDVLDFHTNAELSHFFGNGNSWTISDLNYNGIKNTPGPETSVTPDLQKDFNNNLSFQINFPALAKKLTFNANASWITCNRFYNETDSLSKHFVNTFNFNSSSDFHQFNFYHQLAGLTFQYVNLNSTDDGFHNQFSGTFKETSQFYLNKCFSISIPMAVKFCDKNFTFLPKTGLRTSFHYADFLLNVYRMIQYPNMDDLYWDSNGYKGNPDLSPETGWGAEFTANIKNIFIPFSISFFTNYYENKIQWASINGKWHPENISSAFYAGIDFSIEQTFFKIWHLRGNLEYLYTKLLNKDNQFTYGNKIMWTPDFVASLINTLNFNYFSLTAEVNYTGKKYTSNLNTTFTEPYFLINICAELNPWKHFIPYLRIDNLLNTDYKSIPEYPMPGISLQLGLKTKW